MGSTKNTAAWIGRRIAAARRFRGWDVGTLAHGAVMTQRRLERCEATGDLTCDELERIAAALKLPVGHFLERCAVCLAAATPPAHPAIKERTTNGEAGAVPDGNGDPLSR